MATTPPAAKPAAPAATPAAEAHAEATGVDISTVEGTGAQGKVTKSDVTAAGPDAKPEADVKLVALHHIQHDDAHFHPGDSFTVDADRAAEMVATKAAIPAASDATDVMLKQANAARERAQRESGVGQTLPAHNRRHDDPVGETFESTPYPDGDKGTLPGTV